MSENLQEKFLKFHIKLAKDLNLNLDPDMIGTLRHLHITYKKTREELESYLKEKLSRVRKAGLSKTPPKRSTSYFISGILFLQTCTKEQWDQLMIPFDKETTSAAKHMSEILKDA